MWIEARASRRGVHDIQRDGLPHTQLEPLVTRVFAMFLCAVKTLARFRAVELVSEEVEPRQTRAHKAVPGLLDYDLIPGRTESPDGLICVISCSCD